MMLCIRPPLRLSMQSIRTHLSGDAEEEHKPRGVLEDLEARGVLAAVVGRLLLARNGEGRWMVLYEKTW